MNFKRWQRVTGRVPDTTVSPLGFVVGDRIHLPTIDADDIPEEFGAIISINEQWPANDPRSVNNAMIVVEVDPVYREDGDDGLRECSDDQVERC